MKRLLFAGILISAVLLLSAGSPASGPYAKYYYFNIGNGGKIYCRILDEEKRTVRVTTTLTCRYVDGGSIKVTYTRPVKQQVEGSIVLPSRVSLRQHDEMYGTDNAVGEYTLAAFEVAAFKDCERLTSITIPSSVTRLESGVFVGCKNLKTIQVPGNIEYIDPTCANRCQSLEAFNVGGGTGMKYESFNGLLCKEGVISLCPLKCSRSLTIPSSVKGMVEGVFSRNQNLESVTFNGGGAISKKAFQNCTNLRSVTINNNMTAIESGAFENCQSLESILIPGTVKTIGSSAFAGCLSLSSITFEEGVQTIDSQAFSGCAALNNVSLPKSLRKMYSGAFENCFGLEFIQINEGLESIPSDAFYFCTGLKEVRIPSSVKQIGTKAFMGCTALVKVVLPPNIKEICRYAFFGCENLKSINVPKQAVTYEDTFYGCDLLSL